jgi:TPR repeat protein
MEQIRRAQMAPDVVARECEAGKVGACAGLRDAYSGGASRLPADPTKANSFGAKANQLVERQCQAGDRDACGTLIQYLLYSSPPDVPRGRRLADEACTKGGYLECWTLADFLRRPGPNQDPAAATGYFSRAVSAATPRCDAGDAAACQLLIEAYRLGRGVSQDRKKSLELQEKLGMP